MEYSYSALQQGRRIRVIHLLPSKNADAPLRCHVGEVDLDDDEGQPFEAISYTWGEATFDWKLHVGREDTCFNITKSLSNALQCFRRKDRIRILWADAVCINQDDDDEKSSQIPLMADIYRRAIGVLVWLGEDAGAEAAMRSLSWMSRATSPEVGELELQKIAKGLGTLLQQPWFHRRWIIQEVVRNHDVMIHCGSAAISWMRLITSIDKVGRDNEVVDQVSLRALDQMRNLWKHFVLSETSGPEVPGHTLTENIYAFSHFDCGNERDRIFALAALSSDVSMSKYPPKTRRWTSSADHAEPTLQSRLPPKPERFYHIVPDYGASVKQVYTSFAVEAIRNGLLSWLLCRTWDWKPIDDFPAWVPDWTRVAPEKPYFAKLLSRAYVYSGAEYTGSEKNRGSSSLPIQADWSKTRLRNSKLRIHGFRALLQSKLSSTNQRTDSPESAVYVRPLWKSDPLNIESGTDVLQWADSLVNTISLYLKQGVQDSFDAEDVNDAAFYLLAYLLGDNPFISCWCPDNAPVRDKIKAYGVPTNNSAWADLNGSSFFLCAQGRAEKQTIFLGFTKSHVDLAEGVIIRPENDLSFGLNSVKPRVRPVRLGFILHEKIESQEVCSWTNRPLGNASNTFELRGQVLLVGLQKEPGSYRSKTEDLVYYREYDFDLV
ncbi:unnamed protein product [Colletotrichum noveboracense]|uniref:Heterokaryon incompatibility domain-containing protein n=1 Tax=Colletotrichum noveboracense TaxID=2664923 RepID=A0A9W4RYQ5_9PEZI|nr:unnamed protein product [Colletotrichum noveboracense]